LLQILEDSILQDLTRELYVFFFSIVIVDDHADIRIFCYFFVDRIANIDREPKINMISNGNLFDHRSIVPRHATLGQFLELVDDDGSNLGWLAPLRITESRPNFERLSTCHFDFDSTHD
jgi:hypothetical protein